MKRSFQNAFSMVELLVVIAIIALLAALFLPVLSHGRVAAHRAVCLNNLRQLSTATHLYWDENQGKAFRYRTGYTNGGDVFWFGWLERGPESQRRFDPAAGALYPYLSGRGVEVCPAFNYSSARLKIKATGRSYGYGYNIFLSSPAAKPAFAINNAPAPARLAVLTDCAQINTFQAPASPTHPLLEEFYYFNDSEATVHFRHKGSSQTLFCDGHVEGKKPGPATLDRRLPPELIGGLPVENVLPSP